MGKDIVILSAPIIIGTGTFEVVPVSIEKARELAEGAEVFSQHQTVKVLGVEPATARKNCTGYDVAIIATPKQRLEFGREYTLEEIQAIGVSCIAIVATQSETSAVYAGKILA